MVKQESDEDYWLGESFSPVFRAGLETLMPTPKFDRPPYRPHVEDRCHSVHSLSQLVFLSLSF